MEHAQRDNENRFNMKTLFYVLILILMEHAQRVLNFDGVTGVSGQS